MVINPPSNGEAETQASLFRGINIAYNEEGNLFTYNKERDVFIMRKRFTEEEFRAMRVLINNGATGEMLMQAFGVGRSLITRVRKANSWSEYREMLEAMAADVRKRNQEKATKVNKVDEKVADPNLVPASKSTASQQMMASNYQLNRLYELMKEETEYLKLISAKLAFIVESLA